MTFLNLGSLLLGLVAWFLPIISLARRKKAKNQNWIIYSMSSVSVCAISLYMQILYQNHLANIGDWSAISDILPGLVFVSSLLLATTIVLNGIAVHVHRRNIDGT
jgi:cytochrome c oxidase subunit 4